MSLRTRLTLYYTAFFACALLLVGFGVYMAVKQSLEQGVEADLRAGTHQVIAIYQRSPAAGLELVLRDGVLGLMTPEQLSGQPAEVFAIPNLFVQVFAPNGAFLGSSMPKEEFLGATPMTNEQVLPLPPAAQYLQPGQELYVTQEIDDMRLRSLITPVELGNTGRLVGILQVSRPLEDVEETLQLLLSILLGGGAITMVVTALGAAGLSRTALTPIDQVVHTAQHIVNADDLGRRVPVPGKQDELQRLSITINEMLTRMETLFKMQHRLVADVSHELRTPLAAMQGNLEVLERGAYRDPELLQESLTDMRQETARLIRMVNDLLLLARSEARVPMRHHSVELDSLLLEVHRELRPLAGNVNLTVDLQDQVTLNGDRDRLKQALLNLGANALQHTPTGGSVGLNLERRDDLVGISVSDTGVGIPPDELPMIFKRFYRVDSSRSRSGGGAGLGLAIVEHVAQSHSGRVTVESEPGKGSTFTIWLPIETPAENTAANVTPLKMSTLAAATDGQSHKGYSQARAGQDTP